MTDRFLISALLNFTVSVCIVAATGCDNSPKLIPVSGNVTIDGKPLDQGEVVVWVTGSRPATGNIKKNGHFTLTTYGKGVGCFAGEFDVTVRSSKSGPRGTGDSTQYFIPERYDNVELSGIKKKIDNPTDKWDIKLTWKGDSHNSPYIVKY